MAFVCRPRPYNLYKTVGLMMSFVLLAYINVKKSISSYKNQSLQIHFFIFQTTLYYTKNDGLGAL